MVPSVVYFSEFCRTSSTQSWHDNVSRHSKVILDTMQPTSRGHTPSSSGQRERGLIYYLFDQHAFRKIQDKHQSFSRKVFQIENLKK